MFDTHTHLNFRRFKKNFDKVIKEAKNKGVIGFVVPGTDLKTSRQALAIANRYPYVFAAVGLHPHHVYKLVKLKNWREEMETILEELDKLLSEKKVVAVGEVGLDKYSYQQTKYDGYKIDDRLISLQKELLIEQIKLAIKHKKSLILHNREATKEFLNILENGWDKQLEGRTVFHCCEPNDSLLDFARHHRIFIGVDGDVTYNWEKQVFIKKVPLAMLVLETDAPFLLPEPLRSQRKYPNEPGNLPIIVNFLAHLLVKTRREIIKATTQNACLLFQQPKIGPDVV